MLFGCSNNQIAKDSPSSVIPVQVEFNGVVHQATDELGRCVEEIGVAYGLSEEGKVVDSLSWKVYQEANSKISIKSAKSCYVFTD